MHPFIVFVFYLQLGARLSEEFLRKMTLLVTCRLLCLAIWRQRQKTGNRSIVIQHVSKFNTNIYPALFVYLKFIHFNHLYVQCCIVEPPSDGPTEMVEYLKVSRGLYYTICALSGVCLTMTLLLLTANTIYRKRKYVVQKTYCNIIRQCYDKYSDIDI